MAPLPEGIMPLTTQTTKGFEGLQVVAFESRLETIADLCRQLARSLRNLAREITPDQYELVSGLIRGLDRDLAEFGLAARD